MALLILITRNTRSRALALTPLLKITLRAKVKTLTVRLTGVEMAENGVTYLKAFLVQAVIITITSFKLDMSTK
jgi:hypothetical protein